MLSLNASLVVHATAAHAKHCEFHYVYDKKTENMQPSTVQECPGTSG